MNKNIEKLYEIAQKPSRKIIGLMSGTSLDGLDIALCEFENSGSDTQARLINFETINYDEEFKNEIRQIFAKRQIDFQQLCLLNPYIGNLHGEMVLSCLKKWQISPDEIDIIASHGQTVFHAPKILHGIEKFPNATLQIGDGDHIAHQTGIITLSDFRQKHCAVGGEGAPLAVYGDYLLFSNPNETRLMLNIGGIANFTYLPSNENPTGVFSTDVGPGNTLIDAFMRLYYNKPYDESAAIGQTGEINVALLMALKNHDFFAKAFPKTTGPELFNIAYVRAAQEKSNTATIQNNDLISTLTRFSAETIADGIDRLKLDVSENNIIYSSGGGVHNPLLMRHLKELLPHFAFKNTDELGIASDAKEAVLFATLANEALVGGNTNYGTILSVSMGKISFSN